MSNRHKLPKILAFLCRWCGYSCADLAGVSRIEYPPSIRVIEVMCSCMVHPDWIINGLMAGLDGVMILGCHPGECHYGTGNSLAERRAEIIYSTLEELGLERKRFSINWVSAAEAHRFANIVQKMTSDLTALGPNRFKAKVFTQHPFEEKAAKKVPFIHVSDRISYYWDGAVYTDEASAQKALSRYLDMEMEAKLVPTEEGLIIYTRRTVPVEKA